ncbi:unnamed protein product, partial [Rotaria sp. Silwood2]
MDQGEINDDVEEEGLKNDDGQIIDDQGDSHSDSNDKSGTSPFNNRIQRTDVVRQVARKGQKRQAEEFLQNTYKKKKLTNLKIGDNVLVPVPNVDRGPTDGRNILAVIIEI